jgi:hypothetical protein
MLIPYSGEVALIKIVGYTLAGGVLRRVYGSRFNYVVFGLLRFVAGSIVWIVIGLSLASILAPDNSTFDFMGLLLERIIVWAGLIFVVFQRNNPQSRSRFWLWVLTGIGWSYGLDLVVALLRWLIPNFGTTTWC